MAEFHSPCFSCRLDGLEECNYPGDLCRFHALWEVTGHGPVVKTTNPSSLLLYRYVESEPAMAIIDSGWPEADIERFMPDTYLQRLTIDTKIDAVPVHPELKHAVGKLLEYMAKAERPEEANIPELDDVLYDFKRKSDKLISHWQRVFRQGKETGWATEGVEQQESSAESEGGVVLPTPKGKRKAR